LPISELYVFHFDKIVIFVKGEYKPIQAYLLDVFLLEIYSLFMLLFKKLLLFKLGKNIMFQLFKRDLMMWCWC